MFSCLLEKVFVLRTEKNNPRGDHFLLIQSRKIIRTVPGTNGLQAFWWISMNFWTTEMKSQEWADREDSSEDNQKVVTQKCIRAEGVFTEEATFYPETNSRIALLKRRKTRKLESDVIDVFQRILAQLCSVEGFVIVYEWIATSSFIQGGRVLQKIGIQMLQASVRVAKCLKLSLSNLSGLNQWGVLALLGKTYQILPKKSNSLP